MDKYKLTDDKGNIERLELIFKDDKSIKLSGKDSIIILKLFQDKSLRLVRESPEVRVNATLAVGQVTKMRIYDKNQNMYVDCDVRARAVDTANWRHIKMEYDILSDEDISDTISLEIGVSE